MKDAKAARRTRPCRVMQKITEELYCLCKTKIIENLK